MLAGALAARGPRAAPATQPARSVAAHARKKGDGKSSDKASKSSKKAARKAKRKSGPPRPAQQDAKAQPKFTTQAAPPAGASASPPPQDNTPRQTAPSLIDSAQPAVSSSGAGIDGAGGGGNAPPPLEAAFSEEVTRRETEQKEELSFDERLSQFKADSEVLKKERQVKQESEDNVLTASYDNPPSILDTMRKEKADPEKVNPFGDSGAWGIVGALVLGAALLAGALNLSPSSTTASAPELTQEQKAGLEGTLRELEGKLKGAGAGDVESLEAAAVTAANLGQYAKSEDLLVKLSALKKDDPDVWRLLAEVRSALKQPGPAAAAYREAYLISEADIETLKGFTGALIADAKPAEAARVVRAARGDAVEGGKLKPIEVELLLAKVYAQWRGHTTQAFQTYDDIIRDYPEDFRGFLAKGVLLRTEGRKSDADRAFLQARYLAPAEVRSVVERVAASDQK